MRLKPPVEVGQVIQYEITGIAHNGAGVGKYGGFTVFTPYAVPGERIQARIQTVKKTYAIGSLIDVVQKDQSREEPICPVFHECGGCQLQHISYERQLELKRQQVIDNFQRIGGFSEILVHPVLGMKHPWRYRNKAQVPFGYRAGKVVAGFYAPGSHKIIDMPECQIQHPLNDRVVQVVKEAAQEFKIPIYDETTHRGILRHVMARVGVHANQLMVVLVTNGEKLPHKEKIIQRLREEFPEELKSVVQNINSRRTNVILGEKNRLLWGDEEIYDTIGSAKFAISPHSFFQVNPEQTEVLYGQVRKYAQLTGEETVIDVYCGIGTISLYLAPMAKRVLGVEIVPEAVEDARKNAELNGFEHVSFTLGAAEEVMPHWYQEGIRADVIVVDPPRKGCEPPLLDAVVGMKPARLVYVSCNPSTLARDAKYLAEKGYVPLEVQPVDMFPHTSHVECVAVFQR